MHDDRWKKDLASEELDTFFISEQKNGWFGRLGPEVDQNIIHFLKTCSVYNGRGVHLSSRNVDATLKNPIAFGRLYTGLHLQTPEPEGLIDLCKGLSLDNEIGEAKAAITKHRRNKRSSCKSSC
ncbi:MAG: hypothetical protein HY753_04955 [Nitrospirae bacterium]|nr:hypothetical protein [Nitrospirota bacterium]